MTNEKMFEILDLYETKIKTWMAVDAIRGSLNSTRHILTMIPELREFVRAGRREKAFRWLGFIQGVLWCEGIYTIEELKKHNMPEGESFEANH